MTGVIGERDGVPAFQQLFVPNAAYCSAVIVNLPSKALALEHELGNGTEFQEIGCGNSRETVSGDADADVVLDQPSSRRYRRKLWPWPSPNRSQRRLRWSTLKH